MAMGTASLMIYMYLFPTLSCGGSGLLRLLGAFSHTKAVDDLHEERTLDTGTTGAPKSRVLPLRFDEISLCVCPSICLS